MRVLTRTATCILTISAVAAISTATATAHESVEQPHGVQYQQTPHGLITWVDGRKHVYTDTPATGRTKIGCRWSDPETDHTVADDVLDRGAGVAFPWTPIRRDLDVYTTTVYKSCATHPPRKVHTFSIIRNVHVTFQPTNLDELNCGPRIGFRKLSSYYTAYDLGGHTTPKNRRFTVKCIPGAVGNTKTKTFEAVRLYGGGARWKNKIGIDIRHASDHPQESHRGSLPWMEGA